MDRRKFVTTLAIGAGALAFPVGYLINNLPKIRIPDKIGDLNVYNVWDEVKEHLDLDTINAMEKQTAYSTVHEFIRPAKFKEIPTYDNGTVHDFRQVQFIGAKAVSIEEAVKKLAKVLTKISREYGIKATLVPAIALKLNKEYAALSYIALESDVDLTKIKHKNAFDFNGDYLNG